MLRIQWVRETSLNIGNERDVVIQPLRFLSEGWIDPNDEDAVSLSIY